MILVNFDEEKIITQKLPQVLYIHRIVVTIRTHSEPTQYCFIKLWADGCLSITQNDDVIDILLKENEKTSEQKGGKEEDKYL